MINAIRKIGKWQIEKSGKKHLDILIREPKIIESSKLVFIKIDLNKKEFEDDVDLGRKAGISND